VDYDSDYGEAEFLYAADNRDLTLILHGIDDSGYVLPVPAVEGPRLPHIAGDPSVVFATRVNDLPDDSVMLPYSLTLIANPAMLADQRAVCSGRLPPTLGAAGETTRLQAVMCRAQKPLAAVVADADADLFATGGLDLLVHEMTAIMANPRRPEDIALARQRQQQTLIIYDYPERR